MERKGIPFGAILKLELSLYANGLSPGILIGRIQFAQN